MSAPTFDLQSHSLASDGSRSPTDVVDRAAAAGVRLLALTDHDTVDGVVEALAAAARHPDLRVVPATELSCVDGRFEDLHLLGYGVDHTDPAFLATLADWRADRGRRVDAMADRLRARGYVLDETELDARRAAGMPLGRPHLAAALLAPAENADQLAADGITSRDEVFDRLIGRGGAAYVARTRPSVKEAIAAVHTAGGVAVWAHPFWDLDEPAEVVDAIDRFVADGLDGVEGFYVTHTREETELVHRACVERGLLVTGSADFHGPEHDRFDRFRNFEFHGLEPRLGPIPTM